MAKLFRVTVPAGDIERARAFYAHVLNVTGEQVSPNRYYFDCGGVILAILDPTQGGLTPTPAPKSLYFAVNDLDAVHARARELGALAPYKVHGQPAAEPLQRPWGERSFYVVDPWGNDLCFVAEGTLYT